MDREKSNLGWGCLRMNGGRFAIEQDTVDASRNGVRLHAIGELE